jgi:hypothetical protein
MRELPNPETLNDAVRCVTDSNRSDGYNPTRFTQATMDGTAPDLLSVCIRLINKGETLEYLDVALRRFSTLLGNSIANYKVTEGAEDADPILACYNSDGFTDTQVGWDQAVSAHGEAAVGGWPNFTLFEAVKKPGSSGSLGGGDAERAASLPEPLPPDSIGT